MKPRNRHYRAPKMGPVLESSATIWKPSKMNSSRCLQFSLRCFSSSAVRLKAAKSEAINLGPQVGVPVETDTKKISEYVCGSNLLTEGDDVKLKPDSEYPEWLWSIRQLPPLEELDRNSKTYWNKIQKMALTERKILRSLQKYKTLQK